MSFGGPTSRERSREKGTLLPGLQSEFIHTGANCIKERIYLPKNTGINYVGLIIGPKGIYQKKLEEQTGCKILIRGKGSHKLGHPLSSEDTDPQHVLIIAENREKLKQAKAIISKVIAADEMTRSAIRLEQLKAAQEMSKDSWHLSKKRSRYASDAFTSDDSIEFTHTASKPIADIVGQDHTV